MKKNFILGYFFGLFLFFFDIWTEFKLSENGKNWSSIAKGGILAYIRKSNKLPSLDLIRAYQNAIKNFCEDPNQSNRNNKSIFRGEPSITFCNQETWQVVIFDRETKIFITAYKISPDQLIRYLRTGEIGK